LVLWFNDPGVEKFIAVGTKFSPRSGRSLRINVVFVQFGCGKLKGRSASNLERQSVRSSELDLQQAAMLPADRRDKSTFRGEMSMQIRVHVFLLLPRTGRNLDATVLTALSYLTVVHQAQLK